MKDLIAKFRAFSAAHKMFFVAVTAIAAVVGGDYALHVRPAAMTADHHPVNLPVKRDPNGKAVFGATGDNGEGIFIDATNHTLDLNSKKIAHVANGTVSTDGAAFGQIAATTLNSFATPTASVNFGSQKLISVADGTASSDGAAFHQIGDAILAGRSTACDALTTANQGTLSGLAQTIDGVALSTAGMRACTFGQTTVTQDGCYVTASGAWSRCADVPAGANLSNRYFVTVAGSGNKGVWAVQPGSNVVGTNDIVVVNQAAGGGGGAVSSVFTRTGAVTAQSGDYTFSQLGQATANVTFGDGTKTLSGVGDPVSGQDSMTLNYSRLLRDFNWSIEWNEDWFGCNTSSAIATNTAIPGPGFYLAVGSGGGTSACQGTNALWSGATVFTALTATGYQGYSRSPTTGTYGYQLYLTTASELYYSGRIKLNQLSNGTDTYVFNWGLHDASAPSAAPTNFLGFRHLNGQANWQFVSNVAGTPTTVDTGVAVDTTNMHRFEITKDFASNTVLGHIDGDDGVTGRTGGPITSFPTVALSDGAWIINSAGTGSGRIFISDAVHARLRLPKASGRGN